MIDPRSVLTDKFSVSHETFRYLTYYHDLLVKWQKRLNLISPTTIDNIWSRHILDCAQLCSFLPNKPSLILDVGTGAGLPGVIISILTDHQVHLVESDHRKCAFLRTVLSRVNSDATIHEKRLENLENIKADRISRDLSSCTATGQILDSWTPTGREQIGTICKICHVLILATN